MTAYNGVKWRLLKFGAVILGVLLTAIGLEMFLAPHKIIPGGIKGIAILLSHVTEMKMGLFLLFINLPSVILKRRNVFQTMVAIVTLLIISFLTIYMHPVPPLFEELALASVFGGLTFGIGVGLVLRYGWYADGVQDLAVLLKKKTKLSIAELIMIINLIILTLGGFLFGWDQAIYSVISYFIAYKSMQVVMEYRSKLVVWVSTDRMKELIRLLHQELDPHIQFLQRTGIEAGNGSDLYFVIPSHKARQLKKIIKQLEPAAEFTVTYAYHVEREGYYRI